MSVFKIVFEGNVAPKRRLVEVKYALSQLYKVEVSKIEHLFNGELHVLKENLTEVEADRYVEALESTGIVVKKADSATFAELMKPKPVVIKPKPIIQKPVVNAIQSPSVPLQPLRRVSDSDQDNNYSDYESAEVSFFSPNGRIGRMRYFSWYFGLSLIIMLIGAVTKLPAFIVLIAQAFFGFVFFAQRLHDLNRSAWWFVFLMIACIGIVLGVVNGSGGFAILLTIFVVFFSLYVALWPGSRGENNYGAPPPKNSLAVKVIFWAYITVVFVSGLLAGIAFPKYVANIQAQLLPNVLNNSKKKELVARDRFMKICAIAMQEGKITSEIIPASCECTMEALVEKYGSIEKFVTIRQNIGQDVVTKIMEKCVTDRQ